MVPGDRFIRYSKYGGAVFGEVASVWERNCCDLKNSIVYVKVMIRTTEGVDYEASECFKIKHRMSESFVRKALVSIFKRRKKDSSKT